LLCCDVESRRHLGPAAVGCICHTPRNTQPSLMHVQEAKTPLGSWAVPSLETQSRSQSHMYPAKAPFPAFISKGADRPHLSEQQLLLEASPALREATQKRLLHRSTQPDNRFSLGHKEKNPDEGVGLEELLASG
jgi:hypothetical protein